MSGDDQITHRTFYLSFVYGAWALMGTALALLGGVYLLWPPPVKRDNEWVDAADLTQLPLETPEEVVFRRNRIDGWKITSERATAWVVRVSAKDVIAFAPQCPHLGCAYHWNQQSQEFQCPCHASTFSIDGNVLAGPAQRPLDRYDVKVEGAKLLLGRVRKSQEVGG